MKKIFSILALITITLTVSAQRGHFGVTGGFHSSYFRRVQYYRPSHTYVNVGIGFGYPGWYGPWYYPYDYAYPDYYYDRGRIPSELKDEIAEIKEYYKWEIKDIKHDHSIDKAERDYHINQLEQERDKEIIKACHDFYFSQVQQVSSK